MTTVKQLQSLGTGKFAAPLARAIDEFKIIYVPEFFGQMKVESSNFTKVRENLDYSPDGLLATFGLTRITMADAYRLGRIGINDLASYRQTMPCDAHAADQQGIANAVYGGSWGKRNLGNAKPGDGWSYIGRGLKQVTGWFNYHDCSQALYGDLRLLDHPELLEQPEDAARSAAWFWSSHSLDKKFGNVIAITSVVTGAKQPGVAQRLSARLDATAYARKMLA